MLNLELVEPATADIATSAELVEESPQTANACGTTYVGNLGNRLTYVGSTHCTTSSGFSNDFVYNTGGTATLGVGTTSGGGGWMMVGTSSQSSESHRVARPDLLRAQCPWNLLRLWQVPDRVVHARLHLVRGPPALSLRRSGHLCCGDTGGRLLRALPHRVDLLQDHDQRGHLERRSKGG